MRINADFSKRVVIRPQDYEWVDSPSNGVRRMMLDRIGEEVARATTIVEFAPGSYFDAHSHDGGEEYLVLDGVFSDESGDYPAGTYVRNPIGTSHQPHTVDGCRILVKLHQFAIDDTAHFSIDTTRAEFTQDRVDGIATCVLHTAAPEKVTLQRFTPDARSPAVNNHGGEEVFVLQGVLADADGTYPAGTWARNPDGLIPERWSENGCLLWVKTGHLPG